MCVNGVAGNGSGTHCSPRHGMPFNSRNEGSQRVSMTWRAVSARPYHEIGQHLQNGVLQREDFKIVYVAPMKALAAEITGAFSRRLDPLGIQVKELTGGGASGATSSTV